jgi:hypothetical protein
VWAALLHQSDASERGLTAQTRLPLSVVRNTLTRVEEAGVHRGRPDGGLDLVDAAGKRVELALGVLFGLAVFLRWPGVRPLLTEAEQERQRWEEARRE